jgi:hypothetical protein
MGRAALLLSNKRIYKEALMIHALRHALRYALRHALRYAR